MNSPLVDVFNFCFSL